MNTLEVMEKYSLICDELELFMQEENHQFRISSSTESDFLTRKQNASNQLDQALANLRLAAPANREEMPVLREARNRVLQKLLKLLLLSRESEQLLLKNSVSPKAALSCHPSAAQLRSAYRAQAA